MLNEEIESKESGFSRRRVVKGVAWTVPVILTTAAAPPASASPGTTAISFPDAGVAISYSQGGRRGTGITTVHITGAAGSISGSVIIAPVGTVHARIGIQPTASSGFEISAFDGNTSTTTFVATAVAGKALDIPVSFFNLEDGPPNKPKPNDVYSYNLTVRLNGVTSTAQTNLTISFK
jgi:hypothetical protein